MKSIYKYSLSSVLVCSIILLSSCHKLDVEPTSGLSSSVFWHQASDADLALAGLYSNLEIPGDWSENARVFFDSYSDNAYCQHGGNAGGAQDASLSGLHPNTNGYVQSVYQNCFASISAVNNFLANVNKVLSGDQLTKYRGEALFLRGFNYFFLAQTYGNVPIVLTDPLTTDGSKGMAKSTRDEVLNQAASDLDSAIAYLPDIAYTGHAVKAAAQGFKVKVLLFQKKWAEAATLANTIITNATANGTFALNPDYRQNFLKPGQLSSKEIMFSVQFQSPGRVNQKPLFVIAAFGWRDVLGTQDMINEYESGDPRKTMSWFFVGDGAAQGWPYPAPNATAAEAGGWLPGYYLPKKWINPSDQSTWYAQNYDQDYVLLRYADIELMYAEAQNEAAGPDASVYAQINAVRARPGVDMPGIPAGLSQDEMRDKIRHERRVEFALEGSRYFDLRRWGIATQTLNGFVYNSNTPDTKIVYSDVNDFWPIPQTEIDRNHGTLKQNAGY